MGVPDNKNRFLVPKKGGVIRIGESPPIMFTHFTNEKQYVPCVDSADSCPMCCAGLPFVTKENLYTEIRVWQKHKLVWDNGEIISKLVFVYCLQTQLSTPKGHNNKQ